MWNTSLDWRNVRPINVGSPYHSVLFAHIRAEQENLRAVFLWSVEQCQAATSRRFARALRKDWRYYLLQVEGLNWAMAALEQVDDEPVALREKAL